MKQQLQGPLLIAGIFLVALVLAGFAWWYQLNSNPQSRAFWDTHALLTIEQGSKVEVLQLIPTDGSHSGFDVHGQIMTEVTATDVSHAPGLVHARHALVVDPTFQWKSSVSGCGPDWNFALRFTRFPSDDQPAAVLQQRVFTRIRPVTIVFNSQCDELWWVEGEKGLVMVPKLADAFRKKCAEWIAKPRR